LRAALQPAAAVGHVAFTRAPPVTGRPRTAARVSRLAQHKGKCAIRGRAHARTPDEINHKLVTGEIDALAAVKAKGKSSGRRDRD